MISLDFKDSEAIDKFASLTKGETLGSYVLDSMSEENENEGTMHNA
jgi:hypothetical protein